ncbi:hypothetical protein BHM03_00028948 [Ensete ventricosum]|nr:hypothetical protein BHM03_00028948 [Ensete ventricosum]
MYRCRTSELKEIKISFCCALVSWLHKIGVDSDVILILIVILVFVVHQRSFQLPIFCGSALINTSYPFSCKCISMVHLG